LFTELTFDRAMSEILNSIAIIPRPLPTEGIPGGILILTLLSVLSYRYGVNKVITSALMIVIVALFAIAAGSYFSPQLQPYPMPAGPNSELAPLILAPNAIPNTYIVRLKDSLVDDADITRHLRWARNLGDYTTSHITGTLLMSTGRFYYGIFSDEVLTEIRKNQEVDLVEQECTVYIDDGQYLRQHD